MDADALGPELVGEVPHRRFQRGLDRAHQIIVRDNLLGAVVAHRDQHAALGHQRLGELRHAHEGMAGDVHGGEESLDRAVDEPALEIRLGRRRSNARGNRAGPIAPGSPRTAPPSGRHPGRRAASAAPPPAPSPAARHRASPCRSDRSSQGAPGGARGRAQPQAIECSFAVPTMRPHRPARIGTSASET